MVTGSLGILENSPLLDASSSKVLLLRQKQLYTGKLSGS
jgi:hypothetical protein